MRELQVPREPAVTAALDARASSDVERLAAEPGELGPALQLYADITRSVQIGLSVWRLGSAPEPGPVLVAYGTVSAAQRQTLAAAAASFRGDSTIGGFRGSDGDGVRAIARRYGVAAKRGQLAVPAVRLVVGDLVEGRSYSIERTPATAFVLAR